MRERIVRRYSLAFQREVVESLESGSFESIGAACRHHGIGSAATIVSWLRRHGKAHLQAKVVRVERQDERDRIRELSVKVDELERALGRTQAEKVMAESYLEIACERLSEDVAAFKKKAGGTVSSDRGQRPI